MDLFIAAPHQSLSVAASGFTDYVSMRDYQMKVSGLAQAIADEDEPELVELLQTEKEP